jgi:hypothetical protein
MNGDAQTDNPNAPAQHLRSYPESRLNDALVPPETRVAPPVVSRPMLRLLASMGDRTAIPFCIVFVDGSEFRNGDGPPTFTLRFRTHRAERRLAGLGHTALLESYFSGEVDVVGEFPPRCGLHSTRGSIRRDLLIAACNAGTNAFGNRTIRQAKANASCHYDLGHSFFQPYDRVGMMHMRLLARRHDDARGSADQQDGSRLLQGRPSRRFLRRHRLRLRRLLVHAWERYGALGRASTPRLARSPNCARTLNSGTCTTDQGHRMRLP